jgi:heterodisulfide reductase subunit C
MTTIMTMTSETGASEEMEFREEVLRLAGQEVKNCIQCGTCSASCPTAHLMDVPIRRLIKLVLEGRKEDALESKSLWLCTSCLLCTIRCPRNIRPMAVVAALKHIYEREGRKCKDSVFEQIFARQIRQRGRVSEFLLSGEYLLRSPEDALQIISFGTELLPKGKIEIDFRGERIEGKEEMERIFQELGDLDLEGQEAEVKA